MNNKIESKSEKFPNYSKPIVITSQLSVAGFPDTFIAQNENKEELGRIVQSTNPLVKLIHIVVSNTWLPYSYKVVDSAKKVIGSITKEWQPWSGKIFVLDENNEKVAYLRAEVGYVKSNYNVYALDDQLMATILGNFKTGIYTINTRKGQTPGKVEVEKQNLVVQAFFPQMRYKLTFPQVSGTEKEKRAIILTTLLLPILTKEQNN